ncbi:serine hydrolase [Luteimonas gilva]|uniref:Serine hydrolase n=1 Tax=Luteimonas gilva TaxID=2572684 RepID=A0A4U5JW91_9GAMM|nr:serine hydrolase domain-containing protein [Luteimonas gilva]TKR32988.1 serine hydrolase [Luteimonas gilva]
MKTFATAALVFLSALSATVFAAAPADPALDAVFNDAVARYKLPGLAVGIVRDGEIVYRRTSGEREVGTGEKIDADTIFKIASNSKAMTAAVLARLVDAGKLKWDDPVVKYLPDFRMFDPWVTQQLQVRDLLIHNSGLGAGAGDLMLWPEPNRFERADVLKGLGYLKPTYSFRSRYAYDNTLYIVAGEVAAKAGGAPYEELVRRELFQPLGLKRCRVGEWNRKEVGNVAQPHGWRDDRAVVVNADPETIQAIPMAAAGGIRCSLNDMLTWAQMWLQPDQRGLIGGKPWLSQAQRDAVWTAHTLMPLSKRMREWDNSHFSAYGYGWRLTDVDGTGKVSHTGTLSGMYSALTLLPQKKIGIVVLINADAEEARTVLTQALVKHFTAPTEKRGVAHYAEAIAREEHAATAASKLRDTSSRKPVAAGETKGRLGVYRDPWFGEVAICANPAGAVTFASAKSPTMTGAVMRVGERLLVDWDSDRMDTEAWLDFDTKAKPIRLTMAKTDPDADFSSDYEDLHFERIGDCR